MTLSPRRFQFSVARLMGATVLVALAAWVATLKITVTARDQEARFESWNLFPLVTSCLLVSAAIGVLLYGKQGVREGAKAGCVLVFIGVWLMMLFFTLASVYSFLSRAI